MKAFLIALASLVLAAVLVAADRPQVDSDLQASVSHQVDAEILASASLAAERDASRLREANKAIDDLTEENRLLKFQLGKALCELDKLKETATSADIQIDGKFPRLIVFSAREWCAPCRVLEKQIVKLGTQGYEVDGVRHLWIENIGSGDDYSIQLIDCSDTDGPGMQMAGRFKVSTFPTTLRISDIGIIESRFTGVIDANTICRYQAGKWSPPPAKPDAKTFVGSQK